MTNPISFCPCPWEAPDVMYALDVDKIKIISMVLDRNYLLGSVGPGTSANHLSKMTKFSAMKL